ncbi:MAG: hypothetical protein A2Y03_05505 [Omnitrophica WOR_2 bacterium GWF2_38_59]|nr:MAG: hypothetical protein A2Y03_05505 [Omnitrophica WOR_2 bacterium GWF2_38_59]OGX51232.1 MAG: hypothetical protein A2243_05290 [Omnitrophica WOR_2 bacterium RIFOXYA2_FULL_38_17]OGX54811.1 MAG: hypothetical protein A2267_06180 [Omnitrophica WOR_2 bacterium RIFOXYA12_FULL_38_10]OGX55353.1 MAG: hypothetical protein A2306_06640 [Omnitrophica WOR_2 bacterium RIFOXYB2_FULL_38_16]OGX57942.1 MAG: hypothetical protein A2447_02065 [Omnitrophica WOR_2 bacterium RIFOXYC2_FULL_38_12]HBG60236.1 hypothet
MNRTKLTILILFLFASNVSAEIIKLHNGDIIDAKVIRRDSDSFTVNIGGVEITYWQDDVESTDSNTQDQGYKQNLTDNKDTNSFLNPDDISQIYDDFNDESETRDPSSDIDIIINDEVGDISRNSKCSHDIKTIYTKTVPGYLIFKAVTETNISKCLQAANMAGAVMEVYIDADNDRSTGQNTFWGKIPGFEFHIKLLAGIDYGNQGFITEGRLNNQDPIDFFASHDVGDCTDSSLCFTKIINSLDNDAISNSELGDNFISAKIPIEKLGLTPGKKIRLIFRESGSKDIKEGSFSQEKYLILK